MGSYAPKIKTKFLGFTTLELVVAISIIFIFTGLGMVNLQSLKANNEIKSETLKVRDYVELARKKTISANYRFNTSSCQNFKGYLLEFVNDREITLKIDCFNKKVNVSSLKLSSDIKFVNYPQVISFRVPDGEVENPVNFFLKHQAKNKCLEVSVSRIGLTNIQDISCP